MKSLNKKNKGNIVTKSFSPASRTLIVTAALVIVIAGTKQAAPIFVPFLLAVFIAVISFPLTAYLQQKGLAKGFDFWDDED